MKKRDKIICNTCGNRLIAKEYRYYSVKYKWGEAWFDRKTFESVDEKKIDKNEIYTPYDFCVYVDTVREIIECSFYNKVIPLPIKHKSIKSNETNDDDSGDVKWGVTFKNIPGALLP